MDNENRKPDSFRNTFVLFAETVEENISRKIIWTIHHYNVAPIALVYGWDHWVALKGYDVSAAPARYDDTSYAINGFYVNNPWPTTPLPAPPPPHTTGDRCGFGGLRYCRWAYFYNTWQTDYMTGAPQGYWVRKFLAVCDPKPPPKKEGIKVTIKKFFDGEKIIDKETAIKYAIQAFRDYRFQKQKFLQNTLRNVYPDKPILVQRLDRMNDFYYTVPFFGADKNIYCLVNIDGRFANYRQAAFAKDSKHPIIFEPLNNEEIRTLLVKKKRIELKKEKKVLTPRTQRL